MLTLGAVLSRFLWDHHIDLMRAELEREACLLKLTQNWDPRFLQDLRQATGARITILSPQGEVLADSDFDPRLLKNQKDMPEVRAALRLGSGSSIRRVDTSSGCYLYVATTVSGKKGESRGILRLSVSLTGVEEIVRRMWKILLVFLAVVLVGGNLISMRFAAGVARPLVEITRRVRRISQGDWGVEVYPQGPDEVGELALALSGMSQTLKEKVRELAESKGRLEVVLANMESGVILVDRAGRINLVNRAARELLGVQERDAFGKSHVEIVKSYTLSQLIDQVLCTGKPGRGEISLIFPCERTLEVYSAPIFGDRQESRGVVVVLHDISEIRRLERVRAEFVANVSHELKTPVTAVKGFAETLLAGALYNYRAAEEFVNIINEEAGRLSRLIHDLLELSKIESKEVKMQIETLELGSEVKRIVNKIMPQLQKKELGLGIDVPHKGIVVQADRDRLEQVLINLLDNSLKYTPREGRVEVSIKERSDEVVVAVKDTGIGIPGEDLPRIFERFYRVDKARSRKLGGTGLGLAIVRHIVEAHGGRVWVESEVGKGSTFYFSLKK